MNCKNKIRKKQNFTFSKMFTAVSSKIIFNSKIMAMHIQLWFVMKEKFECMTTQKGLTLNLQTVSLLCNKNMTFRSKYLLSKLNPY